MRLVRSLRVAGIICLALLGSCSSGESSSQPEDTVGGVSDPENLDASRFWATSYDVVSIEPAIEGFDPLATDVTWTLGSPDDRSMFVDAGCNEITAYEFVGDDLSVVEAQIDQTLKECLEPLASVEATAKAILRGPSVLASTGEDQVSIASEGATVVLRRK